MLATRRQLLEFLFHGPYMRISPLICQRVLAHVRDERKFWEFINVIFTCWLHVENASELTIYLFRPHGTSRIACPFCAAYPAVDFAFVRNVLATPTTPSIFPKVLPYNMGGVLPYKWEAYCSTNGRRIAGFPFVRSLEARKVWRYKWGAYCRTNGRCTAVLLDRL